MGAGPPDVCNDRCKTLQETAGGLSFTERQRKGGLMNLQKHATPANGGQLGIKFAMAFMCEMAI